MKGERLRTLLKFCGYDGNSLTFKALNDELDELERLADIGRATENAYNDGKFLIDYAVGYSEDDCGISIDTEYRGRIDNVEELLEWAKGGK